VESSINFNPAVVIGIDRYDNIYDLSTPVSDVIAIADLLKTKYEYQPKNVLHSDNKQTTLDPNRTEPYSPISFPLNSIWWKVIDTYTSRAAEKP
jgi:hypothetical protein